MSGLLKTLETWFELVESYQTPPQTQVPRGTTEKSPHLPAALWKK